MNYFYHQENKEKRKKVVKKSIKKIIDLKYPASNCNLCRYGDADEDDQISIILCQIIYGEEKSSTNCNTLAYREDNIFFLDSDSRLKGLAFT